MKRRMVFLLTAAIGIPALADSVPAEFHGTWGVASAATAARIAADPEMTAESKAYWAKRFTDGPESKIELHIAGDSIELPGFGAFSVTRILEESPGHTSLSSLFRDPRSNNEIKVVLDFQLEEAGTLNMHLDSGGELDDDDLGRVIWARRTDVATGSGETSGNLVHYLDSLKSCEPGEFHFTNTGMGEFRSSIVGRNGDRCRVFTEYAGHRVACSYSDTTIALLTTEQKYDEARNGVLQGSTDSEESKRLTEECALEDTGE